MFKAYGNFDCIYYYAILLTVTELFICGENQPTNIDWYSLKFSWLLIKIENIVIKVSLSWNFVSEIGMVEFSVKKISNWNIEVQHF